MNDTERKEANHAAAPAADGNETGGRAGKESRLTNAGREKLLGILADLLHWAEVEGANASSQTAELFGIDKESAFGAYPISAAALQELAFWLTDSAELKDVRGLVGCRGGETAYDRTKAFVDHSKEAGKAWAGASDTEKERDAFAAAHTDLCETVGERNREIERLREAAADVVNWFESVIDDDEPDSTMLEVEVGTLRRLRDALGRRPTKLSEERPWYRLYAGAIVQGALTAIRFKAERPVWKTELIGRQTINGSCFDICVDVHGTAWARLVENISKRDDAPVGQHEPSKAEPVGEYHLGADAHPSADDLNALVAEARSLGDAKVAYDGRAPTDHANVCVATIRRIARLLPSALAEIRRLQVADEKLGAACKDWRQVQVWLFQALNPYAPPEVARGDVKAMADKVTRQLAHVVNERDELVEKMQTLDGIVSGAKLARDEALAKARKEIEEGNRLADELDWHKLYVRPPDDPNNPRQISLVFKELERLRAAHGAAKPEGGHDGNGNGTTPADQS
ncbi:MAG: hypothetical protein ACYTFD_20255 [Planctomycetota bacterium]|jgi:hypothetical protein